MPIEEPSVEPGCGDEFDNVPPIFNDFDNSLSPLSSALGCRRHSFTRDDRQSEDELMTDICAIDEIDIASPADEKDETDYDNLVDIVSIYCCRSRMFHSSLTSVEKER
jgi:hypothetical protein